MTVDGVRIVFDDSAGHPPVLVVLHGFLGSAASMIPLVEALDAHGATAGRRVVAIDLIGHGRSDAPAALEPYAMDRVVGQVGAVTDMVVDGVDGALPDAAQGAGTSAGRGNDGDGAEGGGTVDLLGYSMGGRIALASALALPRSVRRLVLIGATAGIEDPAERRSRRDADAELAAFVIGHGIEAFVDRWERLPIFATQRDLADVVRRRVRAGRIEQRPVGVANSLRATGTGSMPPMWDRLAARTAPTLVVAGALDAKYVALGGRLADGLPAGRFRAIAEAGHAAHVERPESTAAVVGEFLGATPTADGGRWAAR